MLQVELSAVSRNVSGKGPMRQLRMQGLTPAVVYGGGGKAHMLQLETKTLMTKLLQFYRFNTVVTLQIDGGEEKKVMVGELQTDPVRDTLIHLDFCEIDIDQDRTFGVPLKLIGVPKGVDLGGELNVVHPEVLLEGKPLDIPDEIEVEVSRLMIGDSVRCGKLNIPDGLRLITDAKAIAVSVVKAGIKPENLEDEDAGEVDSEPETTEETESE